MAILFLQICILTFAASTES